MKELYNITAINQKDEPAAPVFIVQDDCSVEVMFTGSALRKTFATLILVFTLAAVDEKSRVLLIEELEDQIYPTLQKKLASHIVRIAEQHKMQLIVTSNSDHVRKSFSEVQFVFINFSSSLPFSLPSYL